MVIVAKMLQLYRDTLSDLLIKRKKQVTLNLTPHLKRRGRQETLENRAIYMLARQAIDLQVKLYDGSMHQWAVEKRPVVKME